MRRLFSNVVTRTTIVFAVVFGAAQSSPLAPYQQTNLVSDLDGVARFTDGSLVNPWGIAYAPKGPFWISDNHAGVSTLYNGSGQAFPVGNPLVVTIPPPDPPSAPTGIVFNPAASEFGGSHFVFATEDGTIAAWTSGNSAAIAVDNSGSGAVYKGLTIANNGTGNFLYAANFHNGTVDVFDTGFNPRTGFPFIDPGLPSGFSPFNIQNIGGTLYVTFAHPKPPDNADDTGVGGIVDTFDANGHFLSRIGTNGTLHSPWGLALAPLGFGPASGDLLVGNFGDGRINAFDLSSNAFIGQLADSSGNPLVIQGLWGLIFGNGGTAGDTNTLFFTAGIPGPDMIEDHRLFGEIQATPEPGTLGLLAAGLLLAVARKVHSRLGEVRTRSSRQSERISGSCFALPAVGRTSDL